MNIPSNNADLNKRTPITSSSDHLFPWGEGAPSTPDDFMIPLTENAKVVLKKRYLLRDENGTILETPVEMFRRVAHNIAAAEETFCGRDAVPYWETEFFRIMVNLEFLPNSPTLMNAGRELQQLSACFVLPVKDSIQSIFDTVRDTALIHKSGGGTGFSFSRIRPKDDRVKTTNGVASGPVSFMSVFDAATEAIKQGGTRRGANMAILRVDHPDILEFISGKNDTDRLKNFNISVAITDSFMEAVQHNTSYSLINPRTTNVQGTLEARKVFEKIVHQAWKNGEPGIVFLDRINKDNPTPHVGAIESTNPCGEQPLLPYESCNLGSINLSKFVTIQNNRSVIDFRKLGKIVETAVRFLDDVIDVNQYPLEEIRNQTLGNRKIGLGVMGFADMLIQLGIPYHSEEAIATASEVMKFIHETALQASRQLARQRGAFPNYQNSKWDRPDELPIRNATVTTIAPTGTLSIIAGCSSGVEPLYSIVYKRRILDGQELMEVHPLFQRIAKEEGFYSKQILEEISTTGTLQSLPEIPEPIKNLFVTAHDVSPDWHVRMQAAFQEHTDNAVSKTINFSKHATEDDVRTAYELAYQLGCKGITVYRDGSRMHQVLSTGSTEQATVEAPKQKTITPRPRPVWVNGRTMKIETGCGSLYVTINKDENGRPFEVFAQIGKAGGCVASQTQSTARLCSLGLRSGIDPKNIIRQLIGITCHKAHGLGPNKILSCSDAIAKALQAYVRESKTDMEISYENGRGACPDCGGLIEYLNGCETCRSCGYSECG